MQKRQGNCPKITHLSIINKTIFSENIPIYSYVFHGYYNRQLFVTFHENVLFNMIKIKYYLILKTMKKKLL